MKTVETLLNMKLCKHTNQYRSLDDSEEDTVLGEDLSVITVIFKKKKDIALTLSTGNNHNHIGVFVSAIHDNAPEYVKKNRGSEK